MAAEGGVLHGELGRLTARGTHNTVAHVHTVAFQGIGVRSIDVQVQTTAGLQAFTIVGLPDKAVGESRERVRGALTAIGLALPPNASPSIWRRRTC